MKTLQEVEMAFSHWRQTRTSRREAIPPMLWKQVNDLLGRYPQAKICRTLRLSGTQIKRKVEGQAAAPAIGFVTAKREPDTVTIPSESATLRIQGKSACLEMSVPLSAVPELLPQLGQLL